MISTYFQEKLLKREEMGNERFLMASDKEWVDFASSDYLGLIYYGTLHSLIEEEKLKLGNIHRWPGTTGSRLLTGHNRYYDELEKEIAEFHQAEAGVMFNSGYGANLGLLPTVASSDDTIIYDSGIHASFHDSFKMARSKALSFRHLDLNHLEKKLKSAKGRIFVCVESIYSIDGLHSDLRAIHQLCQNAGAYLIVDEAHSLGWMGEKGVGAVQIAKISVFARAHPFSKALGCQGAIILGSSLLRKFLVNFSRPLIYTSALSMQNLVTIRCAYLALKTLPEYRYHLVSRIDYFRKKVKEKGIPFLDSFSPIQCLVLPGNDRVKAAAGKLQKKGFDVRPLLSPTVRRGKECLRICLHAFNTDFEINALLEALENICES